MFAIMTAMCDKRRTKSAMEVPMTLLHDTAPPPRRRKRGHHLELALSGAYGSELAAEAQRLLGHVRDPRPVDRQNVEAALASSEDAQSAHEPVANATKPGPTAFRVPLPEGHDAETLASAADAATGEKAVRLRVMAGLYSGLDPVSVADQCGVDLGKVYLWLARFRENGLTDF